MIGENIHVVCHLHELKEGAYIKVDPGQLNQLILNLAVNARDAMPGGGKLAINTGRVRFDSEVALKHPSMTPGDYVLQVVVDDGSGELAGNFGYHCCWTNVEVKVNVKGGSDVKAQR